MKQAMPAGRRGFTLVEIVVVLGVFGILTFAGADFIVQTIQSSNRIIIENEVRQNASNVLQDISRELRAARCVNYYAPTGGSTAILRISADRSGSNCSYNFPAPGGTRVPYTAYTVEYYQDANGVVTKAATSSSNVQISFGPLTSGTVAALNCAGSAGSACGLQSGCNPGLVVSLNSFPAASGSTIGVNLTVQQALGKSRSDFCAATSLFDTIVMRNF